MILDTGIEVKWLPPIFSLLSNETTVVSVMDTASGTEYAVGSAFTSCVVTDGEFVVYFVNVEDLGTANVVFVALVVNFLALSSIVVAVNNLAEEVKILTKVVAIVCVVVICAAVCKADVVGIFDTDNESAAFVKLDDIDIDCVFGIVGEDDDDGIVEDVGMFNVSDIVDVIIDVVEGVFDDFAVANDEDLFWSGVYWDTLFIVVVVWVEGFAVEDIDIAAWGVVGLCSLLLSESLDEVVELVRGLVEVDT